MVIRPEIVKTREVKANRKIPVPSEIREILTEYGDADNVIWNIHKESQTIVLSSDTIGDDDHRIVDITDFLDDGRYIRPPSSMPEQFMDELEEKEVETVDVLSELFGKNKDEIFDEVAEERSVVRGNPADRDLVEERLNETVKNSVTFVVYSQLLSEEVNKVLLMTKSQMQERMPSVKDILRREEEVEAFDPFDLPSWEIVSMDSSSPIS